MRIGLVSFLGFVFLQSSSQEHLAQFLSARSFDAMLPLSAITKYAIDGAALKTTAAANTGLYSITAPGYYYLAEDLIVNSASNSNPVILIAVNNVTLDLAGKSIVGSGATSGNLITAAVQIADGIGNVLIKNGRMSTIGTVAPATSAAGYGILVNNSGIQTVRGIHLEDLVIDGCGQFGIAINNCTGLTLRGVQCIGNGPYVDLLSQGLVPTFAGGACLIGVNGGKIINSMFTANCWNTAATPTQANNIVGLYLDSCSNVLLQEIVAGSNKNITTANNCLVAGVCMLNVTTCNLTDLYASSNIRTGDAATTIGAAYGVYMRGDGNRGARSSFSGNRGINFVAGLVLDSVSTSNNFVECTALHNTAMQSSLTATAHAYGFYILNGVHNSLVNCRSESSTVNGSITSSTVRTAVGFYSAGSIGTQFIGCTANGNNIASASTNFLALNAGGFSLAAGFQLGDNASGAIEQRAILRNCVANYNATYNGVPPTGTTLARAFGIVILPWPTSPTATNISKNNVIEFCTASSNCNQNTSTILNANSYGVVDLTPGERAGAASNLGSTTLLRANSVVGHGATFTGRNTRNIAANNMNFYADFSEDLRGNLNKVVFETVISDLTVEVDSADGANLYNLSFKNSTV